MDFLETGFRYTFYNGGNQVVQMMRFSISPSSAGANGETNQNSGYWPLVAPKEGFFTVPSELSSGNEVVRVNFAGDIRRNLGKLGVVQVEPNWDPEKEDSDKEASEYPVAPTKEAAVIRGKAIWQLHLRRVVESHLADCDQARSAGGAPRAATGFTKKAFKLLNVTDPGEAHWGAMQQGAPVNQGNDQMHQLLLSIVLALATGQKVDPELLKAVTPSGVAGGKPAISGVTTGKITKPIGEFNPRKAGLDGEPVEVKSGQVVTEAYDRNLRGELKNKTSRAAEAEKAMAAK